jgi:hypothetical protein
VRFHLVPILVLAAPQVASAQLPPIPREQEIELALSAAPPAVASGAGVYVYADSGYVRARESTNGFTCLINRDSFLAGYEVLKPTCWDAAGSATIVPQILFIGKRKAAGANAQEVRAELQKLFDEGKLKYPEGSRIAYMLQGDIAQYDVVTRKIVRRVFPPHLMLYAPGVTQSELGISMDSAMQDDRAPMIYSPDRRFSYIVVRVK